jgi:hypothetical protein
MAEQITADTRNEFLGNNRPDIAGRIDGMPLNEVDDFSSA